MSDMPDDNRTFVSTATGEVVDIKDMRVGDMSIEDVHQLLTEFFPGEMIRDDRDRQDFAYPSSVSAVKVRVGDRPLSPLERLLQLAREQRDLLLTAGYDAGFDTPEDCDDFDVPEDDFDPRFVSDFEEIPLMKPEYVKTKSGVYAPKGKVKDTSVKPVKAPTKAEPERDTGKEGSAGQPAPKRRNKLSMLLDALDDGNDSD